MRTTAKRLGWCAALGLTLSVSSVFAGAIPWPGGTHVIAIATGQLGSGNQSANRRVADQWLRQAREAMKTGNIDLAEHYLERAEKMNVRYDSVFARMKDTPIKVRKDLLKMRAEGGQAKPKTGSALTRLLHPNASQAPPTDAYGGGNRLPTTDTSRPTTAPAAGRLTSGPGKGPTQVRSRDLLLAAREALANGDTQRAELLVGQCKGLGLTYPMHEDSPEKIETLIRKAKSFGHGPANGMDPKVYTRSFAQFLMDQGAGLLRYGKFTESRRMAQQAKDLRAEYGQFDRTPDQLLQQIAAARRASTGAPQNAVGRQLSDVRTNEPPRRLPQVGTAGGGRKVEAVRLVAQAQAALDRNDLATAKRLAEQAQGMVPDAAYSGTETRPWEVLLEVNKAMNSRDAAVLQAGFQRGNQAYPVRQATTAGTPANGPGRYPVAQGIYNPAKDATRNVAAQATSPTPATASGTPTPKKASAGERLFRDGMQALSQRDAETALRHFREAWKFEKELDPATRQQLQDKLTLLQPGVRPDKAGSQPSTLEAVDAKQHLLRQKLYREITSEQAEAQQISKDDPKGALARLEQLRVRVSESEVDPGSKKQLLTLVDRNIDSLQQYIETNRSAIDLAEQNAEVLQSVSLDSQRRQEVREKIAQLVEEFNQLLDEKRYPEAEMIAKKARELDPESAVVQSLMWKSRFVRRVQEQVAIDERKEQGFYDQMTSVHASSEPFDDSRPIQFGDPTQWEQMSISRKSLLEQQRQRLTEAEIEIQKAMKNKVDVKFTDRPLSEVLDVLSELSSVPIVLDPVGLAAEGVTSESPVTIRLNGQISLRSALNLILEPLRLSFVIQNEVLRVTSEQTRDSNTYTQVYNVADLVIPIPNFVPGYGTGLSGAIRYAHDALGYGNGSATLGATPFTVAANDNQAAMNNTSVLAQLGAAGLASSMSSKSPQPMGQGPGGLGGAALADFDTLIDLITSTIAPDSWTDVGGSGAIEPFPTNLSLVISQTQEVHEQIADLLDQLRRLQDLQVTIEVRFITLNDNFFERLGIDFDFSIDDNVNVDRIRGSDRSGGLGDDEGPSVVFGLSQSGPTQTLDL